MVHRLMSFEGLVLCKRLVIKYHFADFLHPGAYHHHHHHHPVPLGVLSSDLSERHSIMYVNLKIGACVSILWLVFVLTIIKWSGPGNRSGRTVNISVCLSSPALSLHPFPSSHWLFETKPKDWKIQKETEPVVCSFLESIIREALIFNNKFGIF